MGGAQSSGSEGFTVNPNLLNDEFTRNIQRLKIDGIQVVALLDAINNAIYANEPMANWVKSLKAWIKNTLGEEFVFNVLLVVVEAFLGAVDEYETQMKKGRFYPVKELAIDLQTTSFAKFVGLLATHKHFDVAVLNYGSVLDEKDKFKIQIAMNLIGKKRVEVLYESDTEVAFVNELEKGGDLTFLGFVKEVMIDEPTFKKIATTIRALETEYDIITQRPYYDVEEIDIVKWHQQNPDAYPRIASIDEKKLQELLEKNHATRENLYLPLRRILINAMEKGKDVSFHGWAINSYQDENEFVINLFSTDVIDFEYNQAEFSYQMMVDIKRKRYHETESTYYYVLKVQGQADKNHLRNGGTLIDYYDDKQIGFIIELLDKKQEIVKYEAGVSKGLKEESWLLQKYHDSPNAYPRLEHPVRTLGRHLETAQNRHIFLPLRKATLTIIRVDIEGVLTLPVWVAMVQKNEIDSFDDILKYRHYPYARPPGSSAKLNTLEVDILFEYPEKLDLGARYGYQSYEDQRVAVSKSILTWMHHFHIFISKKGDYPNYTDFKNPKVLFRQEYPEEEGGGEFSLNLEGPPEYEAAQASSKCPYGSGKK